MMRPQLKKDQTYLTLLNMEWIWGSDEKSGMREEMVDSQNITK